MAGDRNERIAMVLAYHLMEDLLYGKIFAQMFANDPDGVIDANRVAAAMWLDGALRALAAEEESFGADANGMIEHFTDDVQYEMNEDASGCLKKVFDHFNRMREEGLEKILANLGGDLRRA